VVGIDVRDDKEQRRRPALREAGRSRIVVGGSVDVVEKHGHVAVFHPDKNERFLIGNGLAHRETKDVTVKRHALCNVTN